MRPSYPTSFEAKRARSLMFCGSVTLTWRGSLYAVEQVEGMVKGNYLVITHIFEKGARPASVWYKEDTKHSKYQQEAEQCSV